MSKLKILGGDLSPGDWTFSATALFDLVTLSCPSTPAHPWKGEMVMWHIASVESVTEEKVKKFAGTAGWGLVGALALGPLGAIGGMLLGGNKTQVTVLCTFKDGQQVLGMTDVAGYQKLLAAALQARG